jgi:hypothetical protein
MGSNSRAQQLLTTGAPTGDPSRQERASEEDDPAAVREPGCVQQVRISRTGVGTGDVARLDPKSYTVVGGPLRLAFSELVLRDPGPGECDTTFEDEVL